MNLPIDSVKLKKGLTVVGLFFVIIGVGVGGYYLGMQAATAQFQAASEAAEASGEGPSYLTNPFATDEADKAEETTENPFYQNPFRTIKGLYTERNR